VRARALHKEGYALFEINVTVSEETFAPSARLLQANMALMEVGEVVAQVPSQTDVASDQHEGYLWLVLATQSEPVILEALLEDIYDLATYHVSPFSFEGEVEVSKPASGIIAPARASVDRMEDSTVRISVERLDTLINLVGELVTDRTRLVRVASMLEDQYGTSGAAGGTVGALDEMIAHFDRVVDQLQEEVMLARMLPIAQLFDRFPRLVRDVARTAGKQVDLVIEGEATELDRSIIEAIGDPLVHLLRNAVDHGVESPSERVAVGKSLTGVVKLTAEHAEGHIVITVQDDGRGVDPARVRQAAVRRGLISEEDAAQLDKEKAISLIFLPNMSTVEHVTDVSGRGVGMDVVQTNIKHLGGSVAVESDVGQGTTFRITLPLTLAILQTMLVSLGHDIYAIPLTNIVESLYLADVRVSHVKGNPATQWRGQALPLIGLSEFFAHPRRADIAAEEAKPAIVVVAWGKLHAGLVVDKLIGKQEIVVKSLSPIIGNVPGLSGCTILGDGRVALIVDIPGLIGTLSLGHGISAGPQALTA
jgi:two-component system chemotaxis sensor kinase CheA